MINCIFKIGYLYGQDQVQITSYLLKNVGSCITFIEKDGIFLFYIKITYDLAD